MNGLKNDFPRGFSRRRHGSDVISSRSSAGQSVLLIHTSILFVDLNPRVQLNETVKSRVQSPPGTQPPFGCWRDSGEAL